ncbi:MAG: YXWGXW repeat-containing protein [Pseudomonadota bacterium]
MMKKLLLAALITTSLASVALPSQADTLIIRVAPPPPREEAIPAPRHGYTWVAGNWDWRNNRHVWVNGSWIRERNGYVYQQPAWEERDGSWHRRAGAWGRGDNDGDGVRNRDDAHPNNPNRN